MSHKTPGWWYGGSRLVPVLLSPLSLVWNFVSSLRWALARPYGSSLPVICVGNLTAGGTGKTPTAMVIARIFQQEGLKPVFLTRGYGGRKKGPHLVDRDIDTALAVGDEPLLLARIAPTVVSANRARGARLIETMKADIIIMDDGFQNPGLTKDLSLLVIDRERGIGNGRVIPAGPLRTRLDHQFTQAHGVVAVGHGEAGDQVIAMAKARGISIFEAEIQPKDKASWLKSMPVIAFSGIGNPEKFFATVALLGGTIVEKIAFADHHSFSRDDARDLLKRASSARVQLVTTEKDMVRIENGDGLEGLKQATRAVAVRMRFKDQGRLKRHLLKMVKPR